MLGDEGKFKQELKQAYFKAKGSLEYPGTAAYHFKGASDVKIHDGGEQDDRMWPYMTFNVKNEDGTTVKVVIAVPDEEDVSNITDFQFIVNGQEKTFNTVTTQDQKRTGDISAGASYILSGIKQAVFGGKRKAAAQDRRLKAVEDLTDDELKAILAARAKKD
jgi:transcriptional/translational regulatory protein YebC/TACO1